MTLEIKSLMSGAIAIVAFCAVNLSAASITWKNSGNDFADGANWNGGVAPADNTTTDIAKFDSASISKQPTLSANRAVAGLDFATPTAGGWIISGPYTFTLGAGTADNGNFGMRALNTSGMNIINVSALKLGANQTWNTAAAFSNSGDAQRGLKIASPIGEDVAGRVLTIDGTGEVILSATNTYSGGTIFKKGRLDIDSNYALGTGPLAIEGGTLGRRLPTGVTITLLNNNAITINGDFSFSHSDGGAGANNTSLNLGTGAVSLGTAAGTSRTISVNNHDSYIGSTLTIGGVISDGTTANSIIKNGGGILALNGTNTYSGNTTITAGTIRFGSAASLGGSGKSLTITGVAGIDFAMDDTFLGRIVSSSSGIIALGTDSSQNLDFSSAGANLPNIYLGALNGITATHSGTLTPNGNIYRLGGGNGTIIITQPLTGASDLYIRGSGNVVLQANNTFSGKVNVGQIGNATLTITHNNALGTADGTDATATYLIGNYPILRLQGNLDINNEKLLVNGGNARPILSSVAGGSNSWNGKIELQNSLGLKLMAEGNAKLYINNDISKTSGSGNLELSPAVGANTLLEINGIISGDLTVSSANVQGLTRLTQDNTYTGITSVNITTLEVARLKNAGQASPLGKSGKIDIGAGNESGTLRYVGTGDTTDLEIRLISGGSNNANLEQAGSGLLKFVSNINSSLITGTKYLKLSGSTVGVGELAGIIPAHGTHLNGVIKTGTGLWILSNANTYAGITYVDGGALLLAHANALPGGIGVNGGVSPLVFRGGVVGLGAGDFSRGLGTGADQVRWDSSGGGGFAAYGADRIVNLGGAAAQVTWGSGNFVPGSSSLIFSHPSATHTIDFRNPIELGANQIRAVQVNKGTAARDAILSGVISGSSSILQKTGAGTLVLAAANTYNNANATAVLAGKLLVNGSVVNGTTVESGATLGGTGTVANVTIKTGGKLAPGDATGVLTAGALTMQDNAEFVCNFGDSNSSGRINVSGLTLGANTKLTLVDAGFSSAPDGDYVLIDYAGADPTLGNWTVDIQPPKISDATVRLDTGTKQVIVNVKGPPHGTLMLIL